MKKLLLLAAFVLVASPAFAQSTATVTSTGDQNYAKVDQSTFGPAGYNEAAIVQTGDSHWASVQQTGSGHDASVEMGGDNKTASVLQRGNGHAASVRLPAGVNTEAYIDQTGGDDSRVDLHLRGSDNVFDIDQTGSRHGAYIRANTGTNDNNTLTLVQEGGDNNEVGIYLQGSSDNMLTLRQLGEGNRLGAWGREDVRIIGDGNTVDALQQGDYNSATISVTGDFNTVDLDQLSSGNVAAITMTGSGNEAIVLQD